MFNKLNIVQFFDKFALVIDYFWSLVAGGEQNKTLILVSQWCTAKEKQDFTFRWAKDLMILKSGQKAKISLALTPPAKIVYPSFIAKQKKRDKSVLGSIFVFVVNIKSRALISNMRRFLTLKTMKQQYKMYVIRFSFEYYCVLHVFETNYNSSVRHYLLWGPRQHRKPCACKVKDWE